MAKAKHYTHEIADELMGEIRSAGQDAAKALALPPDGHGNVTLGRKEYADLMRRRVGADPTYVDRIVDRLAPAGATLPDGTPLRSPAGVRNVRALFKEVWPEAYAAVTGDNTPLAGSEEVT